MAERITKKFNTLEEAEEYKEILESVGGYEYAPFREVKGKYKEWYVVSAANPPNRKDIERFRATKNSFLTSSEEQKLEEKSSSKSLFSSSTDYSEIRKRILKPIVSPGFIQRFEKESVSRIGQTVAAVTLPLIIMFSLIAVEIGAETFADIALNGEDLGDNFTIMGFIVTMTNISLFAFSCWFWFQWVRTGGLGLFAF